MKRFHQLQRVADVHRLKRGSPISTSFSFACTRYRLVKFYQTHALVLAAASVSCISTQSPTWSMSSAENIRGGKKNLGRRVIAVSSGIDGGCHTSPLKDAYNAVRRGLVALSRKMQWYLRALFRVAHLTSIAAPVAMALPIEFFFGQRFPELQDRLWNLVTRALERGGPVFIKLAQWAATREDLFPAALTAKFCRLQDRTTLHAWKHTEDRLDVELPGWRDRLVLQKKPVGSGCIAQVYKGTLRRKKEKPGKQDSGNLEGLGRAGEEGGGLFVRLFGAANDSANGRTKGDEELNESAGKDHTSTEVLDVAVKVLHPGVNENVALDMELLCSFVRFFERMVPRMQYLSLGDLIREFEKILILQLDMRVEAANLERLRANFLLDPELNKEVTFPEPHEASSGVLVETFIDGLPVREFLGADVETRMHLSDVGLRTVLHMIFMNNFVHADMHPGNILIYSDDRTKPVGKTRVASYSNNHEGQAVGVDPSGRTSLPEAKSVDSSLNKAPVYHPRTGKVIQAVRRRDTGIGETTRRHLKVAILDAGMAVSLPPEDHKRMVDIMLALMRSDGRTAGKLIYEGHRGKAAADKALDAQERFISGMSDIVDESHKSPFFQKFGKYTADICGLACNNEVKLNEQFVTMAMAIKVMEGMIVSLNPDLEMCKMAIPFCLKAQALHSFNWFLGRQSTQSKTAAFLSPSETITTSQLEK